MAEQPKYITLKDNKLSLKDLLTQISAVLEDGVPVLKITGAIQFADQVSGVVGGLRYNLETSSVEYSNDGGATWNVLSSESFWWKAGKAYTVGTVVLHDTGWYVCRTATDSAIPGTSAEWNLLTPGTIFQYVTSAAQFKAALETAATRVTIIMKGDITAAVSATVTAEVVTIYSDENTSIHSALSIAAPSTGNIYWHSQGTEFSGGSLTVTSGTLWIDRIKCPAGAPATLTGDIKYQRIDGAFTGGTINRWSDMGVDDLVPKDLSTLTEINYADALKLYVDAGNQYGYLTMASFASRVAEIAAAYFQIDLTGPLNIRPSTAPQGYIFYASDTGDLYIMGENNVWGPAIHIQGPAGKQGQIGYTIMPAVDSDGNLSWTAQLISQTETGPEVPQPINIKGADGKSAFVIWKEEMGNPGSTVDDFLEALGIGNRRMIFTYLDVVEPNKTVTFQTKYPFIGVLDNVGLQWNLENGRVHYNEESVTINLTDIYQAKGLVDSPASITTGLGSYARDTTKDAQGAFAWYNAQVETSTLFTALQEPAVASYAYTNPQLTENPVVVNAYVPEVKSPTIEGNWYGLFGGGGGNDGGTGDVELVEIKTLPTGSEATLEDAPESTSLHRKYILGIPEGPTGYSYSTPEPFDLSATYYPPSADRRYYTTVLHQGGTWVYISTEASSGHTPPELPETRNDWWQLIAKPGDDGEDIGAGISVHKFQTKKPSSKLQLYIQMMRSPTGIISEAALFLDTLNTPEDRAKVRCWNPETAEWDLIPADGYGPVYNNNPVNVDMSDLKQERYLFYRWVTADNQSYVWRSAIFPNSGTIDYLNSITPDGYIDFTEANLTDGRYLTLVPSKFALAVVDNNGKQWPLAADEVSYDFQLDQVTVDLQGVMERAGVTSITGTWKLVTNVGIMDQTIEGDHTHSNKPALDLIGIDLNGNITIDGAIVVPANERGGGLYLIDPENYADTTPLVDPGAFSVDTELVRPGDYNAIRVYQQLHSETYNIRMDILNPFSYNTTIPRVNPGVLPEGE